MQEVVEKYLKCGHSYDFDYEDPPEIDYEANLIESCMCLDKMAKEKVLNTHHEYQNPVYLLSGGLDSSWLVSYLKGMNIDTVCISSWNEPDVEYAKIMSDFIGSKHRLLSTIDMKVTPDLLHNYVQRSVLPTCLPIGLFWFLVSRIISKEGQYDGIITGDGIDTTMIEDPVEQCIRLAILRGEYSIQKCQKYARDSYLGEVKGWIKDLFRDDPFPKEYIGNFRSIYDYLFTDEEIEDLGLNVFQYQLRKEDVYHLFQVFLEYKKSTNNMFFGMSDVEMRSPLFESPIDHYCMRLPFEMRECANVKKLPVREICFRNGVPEEIFKRKKLDWKSQYAHRTGEFKRYHLPFDYSVELGDMNELVTEYLHNPNRKIFNLINFESCQKFVAYKDQMTMKIWSLLLLSMWMENNHESISL